MKQNKIARRLLKSNLVPLLEADGFKGKFPDFQRFENGELHLLSVEFDKYGGGFFLEFASLPSGNLEKDITVAYAAFDSRARLQNNGQRNSMSEDWFRYENMSENEIEELIQYVGSLLHQINDWLRDKIIGKNVSAP